MVMERVALDEVERSPVLDRAIGTRHRARAHARREAEHDERAYHGQSPGQVAAVSGESQKLSPQTTLEHVVQSCGHE